MTYKSIEMRGYWIRMKGQQRWSLLISTNTKLTFIKAMSYYKNKWSIEVFFKDCKQNLDLSACQATNLDAHMATTSIVFMNYMVLALKKRFEDYDSLGILFRDFKDLMLRQTILERIWKVLIQLFDSVFSLIDVFFAHPYHSWERGSNENLNGLIRQYLLKKTDFSTVTEAQIKEIENKLNNRPRKRYGFNSPIERMKKLLFYQDNVAFVT